VALVNVLLSVTDQNTYLGPMLDSVLEQQGVEMQFCVRADRAQVPASVLELFVERGIELTEIGPELGLPGAYLRLLSLGSESADYCAFADHDDLWDLRKLAIACDALAQVDDDVPALWVCQVEPFGDAVDRRPSAAWRAPLEPSVGNALVQTLAPGCAMVWNRALQQLLRERPPTSGVLMHDAWLYLVAASIGEVLVDQRPLVRYRIHNNNAVGLQPAWRHRIRRLIREVRSDRPTIESQAAEALGCFGDLMRPEAKRLVETVAAGSSWQRLRAVGSTGLRRSHSGENAALRARMLVPARVMNSRQIRT